MENLVNPIRRDRAKVSHVARKLPTIMANDNSAQKFFSKISNSSSTMNPTHKERNRNRSPIIPLHTIID